MRLRLRRDLQVVGVLGWVHILDAGGVRQIYRIV